jgi:ATP-dependent Clp protease ATP-binding subunit ClpA
MGVQPDVVRREVEKNVQTGPSMVTMGQLPFTPRVKRALELAMAEAMDLRHNYIGTEHLLLGLIKERDGVAAQVLRDLGCELEKARALVGEIAGQSPEPSSGPRGIPLSEVRELLQSYLHRHGARADLKSGPPVIQATEFELVDADDRVRARLGFDENGEPRLELLDEDGNVTGRFPEKPGT